MPPSGVTVYDFQVLQDIVGATSCLYIEFYDHFREKLLSKNQSPFGHFLFLMKVAYNRLDYSLISLPLLLGLKYASLPYQLWAWPCDLIWTKECYRCDMNRDLK